MQTLEVKGMMAINSPFSYACKERKQKNKCSRQEQNNKNDYKEGEAKRKQKELHQ